MFSCLAEQKSPLHKSLICTKGILYSVSYDVESKVHNKDAYGEIASYVLRIEMFTFLLKEIFKKSVKSIYVRRIPFPNQISI